MCGISGIVDLRDKGLSLSRLQTMNDSVIHRGPDEDIGVSVPAGRCAVAGSRLRTG